ncbi:DnaJ domain-containing protein [Candidatus Cyanaurora vandensis]|uniref:DnaJ domain-containing protein n=1 Tax=Candidatus Cyanaurora vandensis TaxID=2714958 RepID=UPI00257D6A8F|nr:DnaJ domain-containing protein [Candidatus Cyanaurora vandensis]
MNDYFTVLGLPRRLTLHPADLDRLYREHSWEAHPDRRPRTEQAQAMTETALLNEAYRTLKDPYRRAQHLLALEGISLEQNPPQSLLMAVFELQELLEDPDTPPAELIAQKLHWQNRAQTLDQTLHQAFSEWDQGNRTALTTLKAILVQQQYLNSLLEKLQIATN